MTRMATVLLVLSLFAACKTKAEPASEPAPIDVRDERTDLMFEWIDDAGDTHVEVKTSAVPESHRDLVRVIDPAQESSSDRLVLVTLGAKDPTGRYPTRVVPRDEFENAILTRRKEHGVATLPSAGAASPHAAAATNDGTARPPVIIYGAAWCGPCHQAAAYLRQRGVPFVEKDIDQDPGAAKEMQTKLRAAGLSGGSIPVIDVRGRVLQGFSAASLDAALGKGA